MQWHQLDHMKTICTLLQTDNHTNTSSLNFYRPDALPGAQPTVSKHWRQKNNKITCRQNQTQTSLTCFGYFRGRPRGLLVGVVSTGAAGMVSSSATTAPSLSTPISRPASCCTWAHKPHTSLYYMRQSTRFCMDTSKLTLYVGGMAWWLAEFVAITRLTHVGPG